MTLEQITKILAEHADNISCSSKKRALSMCNYLRRFIFVINRTIDDFAKIQNLISIICPVIFDQRVIRRTLLEFFDISKYFVCSYDLISHHRWNLSNPSNGDRCDLFFSRIIWQFRKELRNGNTRICTSVDYQLAVWK